MQRVRSCVQIYRVGPLAVHSYVPVPRGCCSEGNLRVRLTLLKLRQLQPAHPLLKDALRFGAEAGIADDLVHFLE